MPVLKKDKERIDKLLVERGFANSRVKAQALIMAGYVLVDDKPVSKPAEEFVRDAAVRLRADAARPPYASRGGIKLEAALRDFAIDPTGMECIDIGSSTGGFTDCLLQHGAARITAIDVGTNQLVWSLRTDPRVDIRENVNARFLVPDNFDRKFDLAVMDVSFISVTKILTAVPPLLAPEGKIIVLIKPQFEVGKGEVGKGGIVRDAEKHTRIVDEINAFAESIGLRPVGVIPSPILGGQGNREFFGLYARGI